MQERNVCVKRWLDLQSKLALSSRSSALNFTEKTSRQLQLAHSRSINTVLTLPGVKFIINVNHVTKQTSKITSGLLYVCYPCVNPANLFFLSFRTVFAGKFRLLHTTLKLVFDLYLKRKGSFTTFLEQKGHITTGPGS